MVKLVDIHSLLYRLNLLYTMYIAIIGHPQNVGSFSLLVLGDKTTLL